MARRVPRGLAHQVRDLAGLWRADDRSDADLLAAFADEGDGAAFTTLVGRHGRAVAATCRQLLDCDADAEDAFQATFIALARKADRMRRESVAGWLQKVAYEVSLNVRKAARRRAAAHSRLCERAVRRPESLSPDGEVWAVVREELTRLPAALRVPLALYYLDGKSQGEVASLLGVTDRAVRLRMTKGLELLRSRMAGRGMTVTAAVLASVLGNVPVAAAVPRGLIAVTAEAALHAAAGGVPTTTAARLALEVSRAAGAARLKLYGLLLVLTAGVLTGGAVGLRPGRAADADPAVPLGTAGDGTGRTPLTDRFGDALPPGAVARIGTLRFRTDHVGGLSAVAFGRGGTALVSAHGGDALHVWDPRSGREVQKPAAPVGCSSVCATADGRALAAAGADEVWAWDWSGDTPRVAWKVRASGPGPATVEFSPDGRLIAVGGDAGRDIRLLDAATGETVRTLPDRGSRFAFSADGKSLASWTWSRSGEVSVWNVATATKRHTLTAGSGRQPVSSVAFSPDGKTLATAGQDRRLRLWDLGEGAERLQLADDADPYGFVGFAANGRTLLEVGAGRVRYWDAATGRSAKPAVAAAPGSWSTTYRLSADGTRLASAGPGGVALHDAATGRELGPVAGLPDGFMHPVAYSRDGATLATATYSEAAGVRVQLWDAGDGTPGRRLAAPARHMVWGLGFAADGTVAAAFGPFRELPPLPPDRVVGWDAATGAARPELKLPDQTRCAALAPDGRLVAAAARDGVALLDRATGRVVRAFPGLRADSLGFAADGRSLAALDATAGRVTVRSLAGDREWSWSPPVPGSRTAPALRPPVALSPDGRLVAVGSTAPAAGVRVVDVTTGAELHPFDGQPHGWPFQEFVFAPDGRTVAASGADGVVRVWEVASGQERHRFAGHRAAVLAVAFRPDGRRLASASLDSTVLVWDLSAPQSTAARPAPEQLWAGLTGADAAAAYRAVAALAETPDTTVPLLKERLAAHTATPEQVRRWVADLASEQFAVREAATRELARRGGQIAPALRQALATATSPEARARLDRLLTAGGPHSPAVRAAVRGVEVLERMGRDPAAARLLRELAALPADTVLGREARAAALRLAASRPGLE